MGEGWDAIRRAEDQARGLRVLPREAGGLDGGWGGLLRWVLEGGEGGAVWVVDGWWVDGAEGRVAGWVVDSDDGGDYEETLMRKDVCFRPGVCRVFQIVYTEVDNR